MKFKDIVYSADQDLICPNKMGVIEAELVNCKISYHRYIETLPAVNEAVKLCSNCSLDEEVINITSKEQPGNGLCKRYIYYFVLFLNEDTDIAYFPYIPESCHRHWINGQLTFIGNPSAIYTASLKKGNNVFCVEKFTEGIPCIRIIPQTQNEDPFLSLTYDNYWYKPGYFKIEHNRHIQDNAPFEFTLIPLDLISLDYDSVVEMSIRAGKYGRVLYEQNVSFKQNYSIDLSFIPNMNEDECERLYVYFAVNDKRNIRREQYTYLFRYDISETYIEKLKKEAQDLLSNKLLPKLIKDEISFYINIMTDQITYFYFGHLLKDIITSINNKTECDWINKSGAHNIYFFSEIDNNYHNYYIVLPKDYDQSQKYKLVLTFQNGHIDNTQPIEHSPNFSAKFSDRKDVIYADIGGDGCTMGSYLGETFLQSEIEHILEHFPIDRNQIYAIANCAGNIAAINFINSYPHLFAGMYVRGVYIDKKLIRNLYNINCMFVFSGKNKVVNYNSSLIKKNIPESKVLYANKYYDKFIDLIYIQHTVSSMNLLMSKELNPYPNTIYYRTYRNRNRTAYYIEIESIYYGKEFAEIHSEIIGQKLIITAKNCTGLKITLPPQINKQSFEIDINGKLISINDYQKNDIVLHHKKKKGFYIADKINKNIAYYHGTGLLDVYLSQLRIVNAVPDDKSVCRVASVFSTPQTNTRIESNVIYPVITINDIDKNTDASLIIVDNNSVSNNKLDLIRCKAPIKMDDRGYEYMNQRYEGKYCIAQIFESPWCFDKSIVYINANDNNLYEKNVFTRKLMLPSYSSGFHPFLNGVALVFDGDKYNVLNDWRDRTFD